MVSNRIKGFFLFCSGAHLDILKHEDCKNEHNKYVGIGSAVFFTAVFAFLSSSYALFTVFKSYFFAILFGIIWAGFIFSLDRYIVSTLKKENSKYAESEIWNGLANRAIEIFKASPRIALAILLAFVISKPLELKIFEREIENELIAIQQSVIQNQEQKVRDRYEPSIKRRNDQISVLQGELESRKRIFDELTTTANQEADGTGGSGRPNLGPIYRAKKVAADNAEDEYRQVLNRNQPTINALREEVADLEKNLQDELTKLKRVDYDGLLARITALGNLTEFIKEEPQLPSSVVTLQNDSLSKKDTVLQVAPISKVQAERPIYKSNSMYYANLAILLLFMCIELAPLLFKILTDRGIYDIKLQMLEEKVYSQEVEQISYLNDEINKRIKIKVGENQNIVERELADNKGLLQKISDAQIELAQEIINFWKSDQLNEIRKNPEYYVANLKKEEKSNGEIK
ncbi:MAG TPA: DUF4407 domain-containing protein [Saprospiraceae bacterium]|nr:DUF4407 domain-containing protein [Saprospiraceae bacterium]HMQ82955.1 DUF4407 domain-containing protein [Saprospiraceae bacterium]